MEKLLIITLTILLPVLSIAGDLDTYQQRQNQDMFQARLDNVISLNYKVRLEYRKRVYKPLTPAGLSQYMAQAASAAVRASAAKSKTERENIATRPSDNATRYMPSEVSNNLLNKLNRIDETLSRTNARIDERTLLECEFELLSMREEIMMYPIVEGVK